MGVFDRLKNLLGGAGSASPATMAGAPAADPAEAALHAGFARRDRYWASVGAVESDVLGHLISPGLMGGAAWPTTRQAYRVVRRGTSIILATDGMSDPFDGASGDDARVNGFGMELFVETADIPAVFAGKPGEIGPLKDSWAFAVLKSAAEVIANAGGVTAMLDRYGVISTEFPGVRQSGPAAAQLPDRFVTEDDALGVLIGRPEPDFSGRIDDMPLSSVRIVPVVLITAAELEHLRTEGAAARTALADRLAAAPSRHVSDLNRPSLV